MRRTAAYRRQAARRLGYPRGSGPSGNSGTFHRPAHDPFTALAQPSGA